MTAISPAATVFRTRGPRESDEAFLYSSFLKSMRDEDAFAGIGNEMFYRTMAGAIESVLATFTVLVAHPESDEDEIAGWLAFKGDALAFIYVKREPWRRQGVARLLFEAARLAGERPCIAVLFPTAKGMKLARLKGIEVRRCSHLEALALTARVA